MLVYLPRPGHLLRVVAGNNYNHGQTAASQPALIYSQDWKWEKTTNYHPAPPPPLLKHGEEIWRVCTQYLLRLNNCGLGHTNQQHWRFWSLTDFSNIFATSLFIYLVHVFIEFNCLTTLRMHPKCVTDRIASAQCPSSYQMAAESVERSVEVDMEHQIRGSWSSLGSTSPDGDEWLTVMRQSLHVPC